MTVRLNEIPGVMLPGRDPTHYSPNIYIDINSYNKAIYDQGQVSLTLNIEEAAKVIFDKYVKFTNPYDQMEHKNIKKLCLSYADGLQSNLSKLLIRAEEK